MFETENLDLNKPEVNIEFAGTEENTASTYKNEKIMYGHNYISSLRLAAGFIMAPLFGLFIYCLLYLVPYLFSNGFSNDLSSGNLSFFFSVIMIGGSLFYAPAVISKIVIMLLIRRYFPWNIVTSIAGSVISAFSVLVLFLIAVRITGSTFTFPVTGVGQLSAFVIAASAMSGILFWRIALFRNANLLPARRES